MTSIFGPPPKKPRDEVLIADYVTVANINPMQPVEGDKEDSQSTEDTQDSLIEKSQSDDEQWTEGDKESLVRTAKQIVIKIEAKEPAERSGVLEPTDFVSVKIEPLDDEHAGEES